MTPPAIPQQVKLDAAVAGPLFMLSAALLYTMLSLLVKLIDPVFRGLEDVT